MFPAMPYSRYVFGQLPWYSLLIVTGICLAMYLCSCEEKRLNLPQDTMLDLALWAVPSGIIGARLYYVIFSWDTFADAPLSALYIWEGGLAIYGAVIAGLITVILFAKRRKLSALMLADIIVPGLVLAQAIGRWGNYFNMEAYGREIVDPRWQFFPAGVLIPMGDTQVWHMATFFYESVWNLLTFFVLWFLVRKRAQHSGTVFFWYLTLYGVGRFVIEGFRTDSLMLGPIRFSQALSLLLVIVSASILIYRHFRNAKEASSCPRHR